MLAQFSGPEGGWRGAGLLEGHRASAGSTDRDTSVGRACAVEVGLRHSQADVVRVRRFSVRQEPGSVAEQTLTGHGAFSPVHVWGQVLGAGRCIHPSRGGLWGPHTEQNWKQISPREGTHQPLHRVGLGK